MLILQHRPTILTEIQTLRFHRQQILMSNVTQTHSGTLDLRPFSPTRLRRATIAAAITQLRPTVVAVDSRPQARILVGKVALLRPATITEVVVIFLLPVIEEVALAPPISKVALTSRF
jgi:hypothetical protein